MIYKLHSSVPEHTRVIFELPASLWADRVSVAGDFNNWDTQRHPLKQKRDGSWQTVVDLPTGQQYQYCYWVDGRWQVDCLAERKEQILIEASKSIVDTNRHSEHAIYAI